MRHRRRPGEGGGGAQVAANGVDHPVASEARQQPEGRARAASVRSARSPPARTGSRGAAPPRRGWSSTSETPITGRRSVSRRSSCIASRQPCEAPVSSSEYAVAARSASAPPQPSRSDGPPSRTVSAALTVSDQVGVEQRAVSGQRHKPGRLQLDELRALGVVDLDAAAEAPREAGRDDARVARARAGAAVASGPPRRAASGARSGCRPARARRGGRERLLPRVVQRAGERQRGRLDHDRRPPAAA